MILSRVKKILFTVAAACTVTAVCAPCASAQPANWDPRLEGRDPYYLETEDTDRFAVLNYGEAYESLTPAQRNAVYFGPTTSEEASACLDEYYDYYYHVYSNVYDAMWRSMSCSFVPISTQEYREARAALRTARGSALLHLPTFLSLVGDHGIIKVENFITDFLTMGSITSH